MISIIIPTYNEAATIGFLIDKINEVLKDQPHEIIVVDDVSDDDTVKIVKSKNATILQHQQRTGGDLSPAFSIIRGDIIVRMDADLEHDPEDIPNLIQHLKQNSLDVVLGQRPEFSRQVEKILTWIYHFPVKDFFTGYVVFSKKLLPIAIQAKMTVLYWEMPLYAMKNKLSLGEFPVKFKRRLDKPRLGGEIKGGIRAVRLFYRLKKKISVFQPSNL